MRSRGAKLPTITRKHLRNIVGRIFPDKPILQVGKNRHRRYLRNQKIAIFFRKFNQILLIIFQSGK